MREIGFLSLFLQQIVYNNERVFEFEIRTQQKKIRIKNSVGAHKKLEF